MLTGMWRASGIALLSLATGVPSFAANASVMRSSTFGCPLSPEHAAILVLQSPPALRTKASGGCPAADYLERRPGLASFQVRNLCSQSSHDILAAYLVEMETGQVWEDNDTRRPVDTADLRTTRTKVCSMSLRGVVPSLLPHAVRKPTRRGRGLRASVRNAPARRRMRR